MARILRIPTIGDRIEQTVAALALEVGTESILHNDSYGFIPELALDVIWKRSRG